jgi:hypothetical protein
VSLHDAAETESGRDKHLAYIRQRTTVYFGSSKYPSVMRSFVENELVREQSSRTDSFVQTSEQFAKYGRTYELIRELSANVREQFANFAGPKFP